MGDNPSLAYITALVKSLALDPTTPPVINVWAPQIELPGDQTPEKADLERELAALVFRVYELEANAGFRAKTIFPDTPNEAADSLFVGHKTSPNNLARTTKPKSSPVSPVDEASEGLREHVENQPKLLDSQQQELPGVKAQIEPQGKSLDIIEQERVEALERRLWKH